MSTIKNFIENDIVKARDVDIAEYCRSSGINIIDTSSKWAHLAEHDSCVINKMKNVFYWNSEQRGGDIIEFVIMTEYEGNRKSFRDAVKHLSENEFVPTSEVKIPEPKPYKYPTYIEDNSCIETKEYLTKERKISPLLIDQLVDVGLLKQGKSYQNDEKNIDIPISAIFKWIDPETNEQVGHNQQGLEKVEDGHRTYKKIGKDSQGDQGFNVLIGQPKNIKYYESTIDMLSYMTLHENKINDTLLVSMEGLKNSVCENYLKKALKIQLDEKKDVSIDSISFCVDNDKAGNEFISNKEGFYQKLLLMRPGQDGKVFVESSPEGKDWNDYLKIVANNLEIKTENHNNNINENGVNDMTREKFKEELREMLEEDETLAVGEENEIIYEIDDIKVYGGNEGGSYRAHDHNVLLFDDLEWEDIINWGTLVVPETETYISNEPIEKYERIGFSNLPTNNNHIIKSREIYNDFELE